MTFVSPTQSDDRVDETGIRWSRHDPPRPYIKQADGKEVLYSRCTSWIDQLESKDALEKWKQRVILTGLTAKTGLVMELVQIAVDEDLENRDRLNDIATRAFEAGEGFVRAEKGTNLHRLSEIADQYRIEDLERVLPREGATEQDIADMIAYRTTMERYGFEMLATETRVVIDHLKVTGTFDRIIRYQGQNFVADVKTGRVDYGALKMSCQLAMYSRGCVYDPHTGERKPFKKIDLKRGLIFHVAQGEARCDVYEVDLTLGWEACQVVQQIRDMRKRGAKAMIPFSHWSES